jgi:beta-propeller repeat-containing protein
MKSAAAMQSKTRIESALSWLSYDTSLALIIDPVLGYSTFLGGTGGDQGLDIAVDATGAAYVTGITASTNFPTTPGAFKLNVIGGPHVFVSKLNPSGSALVYSTYVGGSGLDYGTAIAVGTSGNAYVTGYTPVHRLPDDPGGVPAL